MIYADYNGSVPLLPQVKDYLKERLESELFANPNAIHSLGNKILAGMEKCRNLIGMIIDADPSQIYFNSGATEGITTVFHSTLLRAREKKKYIVTSCLEHSATIEACKYFEKHFGFNTYYIPATTDGDLDLNAAQDFINKNAHDIALISIMLVNNETGVIFDLSSITMLSQKFNIPFLCDTTQAIGKIPFSFKDSGFDFAVTSSHKLGALPGAGFLIAKNPELLDALIVGGGQEKNKRSGTQNYLAIETMCIALNEQIEKLKNVETQNKLKHDFEAKLKKSFKDAVIFGQKLPRLAGTTLVAFPGLHGQGVQIELESQNIFVTTSSACSDNEPSTSKVLKAMGVNDDIGRGVIRISLGPNTDEKVYAKILSTLEHAYKTLHRIASY